MHTHTLLLPYACASLEVCQTRGHDLEPAQRGEADTLPCSVQPALLAAVKGIFCPLHHVSSIPCFSPKVPTSRVTVTQDPASASSASSLSPATVQADSPIRRSRVRQSSMVSTALSWDPRGAPLSPQTVTSRLRPLSLAPLGRWGKLHLFCPPSYSASSFSLSGPRAISCDSLPPPPAGKANDTTSCPEKGPGLLHCRPPAVDLCCNTASPLAAFPSGGRCTTEQCVGPGASSFLTGSPEPGRVVLEMGRGNCLASPLPGKRGLSPELSILRLVSPSGHCTPSSAFPAISSPRVNMVAHVLP